MIIGELQSKIKKGDFVEIFREKDGYKDFAGYVTEIYSNAFVLQAEGMISGKERNEFIQTKSLSMSFDSPGFIATWYEKHL